MAVVVGRRAEGWRWGRGCGCKGCRVCGDEGLVVLVEERRGVECGEDVATVLVGRRSSSYHDADFGG